MTDLALGTRDGLPDALRVLLADFPRDEWQAHPHFRGLVSFWMERHVMFRRLLESLRSDAERAVDGALDPEVHARRLAQQGSLFLNQLHGHHQIEDMQYFPVLMRTETSLSRGFDILDQDHHRLDALLAQFADTANAVLQRKAEAGVLHTEIQSFEGFLNRHLLDEEDLVVPVILKHGPEKIG